VIDVTIKVTLGADHQGLPCVDWIDGTERYWLPLWEAVSKSIQVDPATLRPHVDFSRPAFRRLPASVLKRLIVVIPPGLVL